VQVILLGDGAVGKTSIATRFTSDGFSQNYKQTVGVDFFIKRIVLTEKGTSITSLFHTHDLPLNSHHLHDNS
jgi:GTPase SAR1 family protein